MLDIDAAQRNIDHMASELKQIGGATIRPHYKTHKSPDLARRQVQAGAGGLSMATVWEAAILAAAGMDDLFVVNTVAHPAKMRALAELARDHRILVAVDEAPNADALSAAAVGGRVHARASWSRWTPAWTAAGPTPRQDALALARRVTDLPGLRFEGITGYEGHCSLTLDNDAAARAAARGDDVLHRRRRAAGGGRHRAARSGPRAASPPGTGRRPSRA